MLVKPLAQFIVFLRCKFIDRSFDVLDGVHDRRSHPVLSIIGLGL